MCSTRFRIIAADHTGITVSNLERSLDFWQNVLGFELSHRAHQTGDLAAEITGFPQGAMRGDRRSAIEGAAIGFDEAMANEFAIGVESLEQGIAGARRFAERHSR